MAPSNSFSFLLLRSPDLEHNKSRDFNTQRRDVFMKGCVNVSFKLQITVLWGTVYSTRVSLVREPDTALLPMVQTLWPVLEDGWLSSHYFCVTIFLYYYFIIRVFSGTLFTSSCCLTCAYAHTLTIAQCERLQAKKEVLFSSSEVPYWHLGSQYYSIFKDVSLSRDTFRQTQASFLVQWVQKKEGKEDLGGIWDF